MNSRSLRQPDASIPVARSGMALNVERADAALSRARFSGDRAAARTRAWVSEPHPQRMRTVQLGEDPFTSRRKGGVGHTIS